MHDRTCEFQPCENQTRSKGLCSGHYQQLRKGAELRPLRKLPPPKSRRLPSDATHKTCTTCRQHLPHDQFSRDRLRFDGIHPVCKPCRRLDRLTRPDYAARLAVARGDYQRHRVARLDYVLVRSYGITGCQKQAMAEQQGYLCTVCQRIPVGKRGLVVDHCHQTGRVRSLLCAQCNTALGLLRESPVRIKALLAYAQKESAS